MIIIGEQSFRACLHIEVKGKEPKNNNENSQCIEDSGFQVKIGVGKFHKIGLWGYKILSFDRLSGGLVRSIISKRKRWVCNRARKLLFQLILSIMY
jgi:hypothetical protein